MDLTAEDQINHRDSTEQGLPIISLYSGEKSDHKVHNCNVIFEPKTDFTLPKLTQQHINSCG